MIKKICPACKSEWFGSNTYDTWRCAKCFAEIPEECEVEMTENERMGVI